MQRVRRATSLRRLVLVVVLTLAGGIALAGCQATPGTAAYVGGQRLTDAQVEIDAKTIETNYVARHPEAKGKLPFGSIRQTLVELFVFNELAKRYASDQGISVPAAEYEAAAAGLELPADDPYVKANAEASANQKALLAKATAKTPTEADLKTAYDLIVAAQLQIGSFAETKAQIAALPGLGQGLGLRDELTQAASRYDLGVSPRYRPIAIPLDQVPTGSGSSVTVVTLPLGDGPGTPAVRDLA